ncbi:MAG: hypothetical protein R2911_30735 [Caldilineaceae bacterium]
MVKGGHSGVFLSIGQQHAAGVEMLLHKGGNFGHLLLHARKRPPARGPAAVAARMLITSITTTCAGQRRAGALHQAAADEEQKKRMDRHLKAGAVKNARCK